MIWTGKGGRAPSSLWLMLDGRAEHVVGGRGAWLRPLWCGFCAIWWAQRKAKLRNLTKVANSGPFICPRMHSGLANGLLLTVNGSFCSQQSLYAPLLRRFSANLAFQSPRIRNFCHFLSIPFTRTSPRCRKRGFQSCPRRCCRSRSAWRQRHRPQDFARR